MFTSAHGEGRVMQQHPHVGQTGTRAFNAQAFLNSTGIARKVAEYRRGDVIFSQGDPCTTVMYLQRGGVKLSVMSKAGREAAISRSITHC